MSVDKIEMKKVNLAGVVPTPEEIFAAEKEIGHRLPEEYIKLMSDLDAQFPSSNSFPTVRRGKWMHKDEIHQFYKFANLIRNYREFLAEDEPLWNEGPCLNVNGNTDLTGFLPIADTTEYMTWGLFLSVDEARDDYGAVYYLNNSADDNRYELVKIASSLTEFLKTVSSIDWGKAEIDLSACGRVESAGDSIEVILERARAMRQGKKT